MNTDLSRREFLKLASSAAVAVHLSPTMLGAADVLAKKRALKKGIMLGTVGGKMPLVDTFKMIKTAGFEGVEVNSHMNQAEVLEARDATGLAIPSVCDAVHWDKPLSHADASVRGAGLEGLKQSLRDAKAYGASSVLLVPGIVNKDTSYSDAYVRSQAEIRKAIPLAEELGVRIALENVWNNFLLSPLEAARFVDEFRSSSVAWQFDVGNILRYGWPEQWIRILGKRLQQLHLKEFSRKKMDEEGNWKGFNVEYLEGDNDWPAVMRALDDIGYTGWAIAEPAYTPPGVEQPARLRQIVEKMEKILSS
jgi:hexulose-6-phosphate isomerase